jgi:hypothetical protein
VHAGLCLGVGVLDEVELWVLLDVGDLGELDKVIDALAVVLEVEARVLEGKGQVDDGLANVLDLLEVADHDLALALVSLSEVSCEQSWRPSYRSVR